LLPTNDVVPLDRISRVSADAGAIAHTSAAPTTNITNAIRRPDLLTIASFGPRDAERSIAPLRCGTARSWVTRDDYSGDPERYGAGTVGA
jgi:hypothetical protein